ncbi:uncharacterized protein LOC132656058 isoform X2 [Meriones unguiculatus]|uniref:uncharacterized protein LOC132656058 isoform X2 n=1 Tax=Meriones unguiculatus TaxID=10047 RepID=UPI00293E9D2B|nr:uncharacterized protein LOC132656058 isoform X2 [Meriones unguiculatus]
MSRSQENGTLWRLVLLGGADLVVEENCVLWNKDGPRLSWPPSVSSKPSEDPEKPFEGTEDVAMENTPLKECVEVAEHQHSSHKS